MAILKLFTCVNSHCGRNFVFRWFQPLLGVRDPRKDYTEIKITFEER